MFNNCDMPDGFTLGEHFDTRSVIQMNLMFAQCCLPNGFTLGEHFHTENVENMEAMFGGSVIPDNFSLGRYFTTDNLKDCNDIDKKDLDNIMSTYGCSDYRDEESLDEEI